MEPVNQMEVEINKKMTKIAEIKIKRLWIAEKIHRLGNQKIQQVLIKILTAFKKKKANKSITLD